jgi:hypothetical protein
VPREAFLQSFRVQMHGFQDLLREKPSSLFMSGWKIEFIIIYWVTPYKV